MAIADTNTCGKLDSRWEVVVWREGCFVPFMNEFYCDGCLLFPSSRVFLTFMATTWKGHSTLTELIFGLKRHALDVFIQRWNHDNISISNSLLFSTTQIRHFVVLLYFAKK